MRLANKLVLALVVVLLSALAASGWLRVRRELVVFRADVQRDHVLLARALGRTLARTWERHGREEALAQLAAADGDTRVDVRWLDGPDPAAAGGDERDTTIFPVSVRGQVVGALLISESREEERAYFRATILRTVLTSAFIALGAATVVFALTTSFVGRPISRLRERTRRIGAGDFSGSLVLRQRDEVGELAADMNDMCQRLTDARRRVEEETERRVRAVEQLRHADRLATVGTLASGIAHELGTPLGVVLARARMIEEGTVAGEAAARSSTIIANQVERMSNIIRQLLDFARGQRTVPAGAEGAAGNAAATPAAREPVELRALARASLSLVEPIAARSRVTLRVHDGAATVARADPRALQQVLLNLLMNAVQAMKGAGEVTITVDHARLTPPSDAGAPPGDYARLMVADQGAGMAPEVLDRIFEPFFTTKPPGQGTGLGLSVSHGIVREQGGWITVESRPDEGSRFTVHLPLARPAT